MTQRRSARSTLDLPSDAIDLARWLFELSDADYQACARGHRAAGSFTDEQGRGTINVESIGGNLIIQHYRGHPDRALPHGNALGGQSGVPPAPRVCKRFRAVDAHHQADDGIEDRAHMHRRGHCARSFRSSVA